MWALTKRTSFDEYLSQKLLKAGKLPVAIGHVRPQMKKAETRFSQSSRVTVGPVSCFPSTAPSRVKSSGADPPPTAEPAMAQARRRAPVERETFFLILLLPATRVCLNSGRPLPD